MGFLDKQLVGTPPNEENELWAPYYMYRSYLMQGEGDLSMPATKTPGTGKRGRGAKRKPKPQPPPPGKPVTRNVMLIN